MTRELLTNCDDHLGVPRREWYIPTLAEIEAATAKIRSGWTEEERITRLTGRTQRPSPY